MAKLSVLSSVHGPVPASSNWKILQFYFTLVDYRNCNLWHVSIQKPLEIKIKYWYLVMEAKKTQKHIYIYI